VDLNLFPMTFPQKEIKYDKKASESETIKERVLWEEKVVEEKLTSVNEHLVNPYQDIDLNLQKIDKSFKDEYKKQISCFNTNFEKYGK